MREQKRRQTSTKSERYPVGIVTLLDANDERT